MNDLGVVAEFKFGQVHIKRRFEHRNLGDARTQNRVRRFDPLPGLVGLCSLSPTVATTGFLRSSFHYSNLTSALFTLATPAHKANIEGIKNPGIQTAKSGILQIPRRCTCGQQNPGISMLYFR